MTDLTAIKVPFGLLDSETQEALKAHGAPYEIYLMKGWADSDRPTFTSIYAYRVKPTPPKPREWWAVGESLHATEADAVEFREKCADLYGSHHLERPITRVREVTE